MRSSVLLIYAGANNELVMQWTEDRKQRFKVCINIVMCIGISHRQLIYSAGGVCAYFTTCVCVYVLKSPSLTVTE